MGLAPIDVMADPTLQPGDIVATADGLKVFQGASGDAHRTAEFTPVEKSAWVSRDVRSRLSKVKVTDKRRRVGWAIVIVRLHERRSIPKLDEVLKSLDD